jgi:hypothetical protein
MMGRKDAFEMMAIEVGNHLKINPKCRPYCFLVVDGACRISIE